MVILMFDDREGTAGVNACAGHVSVAKGSFSHDFNGVKYHELR
jgi:hypothetical protein